MSDLRKKLIRLAHQKPELRKDLLPLLKQGSGLRWLSRTFGLTKEEAEFLSEHPKQGKIIDLLEEWRDKNGLPAKNSPLTRGKLLSLMKKV